MKLQAARNVPGLNSWLTARHVLALRLLFDWDQLGALRTQCMVCIWICGGDLRCGLSTLQAICMARACSRWCCVLVVVCCRWSGGATLIGSACPAGTTLLLVKLVAQCADRGYAGVGAC